MSSEPDTPSGASPRPPPSPAGALLLSLLVYPGLAHLKLGHRRAGGLLAALFTALLLAFLAFACLPHLRSLLGMLDAAAEPEMPPDPGLFTAWLRAVGAAWLLTGLDAFRRARAARRS